MFCWKRKQRMTHHRRGLPPAVCHPLLIATAAIKGVGRHRQGGGHAPLLARKFFHFGHWSDQKSRLSPPPGNWKMAGEPSPGAPESPPLEKFLATPLAAIKLFDVVPLRTCVGCVPCALCKCCLYFAVNCKRSKLFRSHRPSWLWRPQRQI